ncbi:uncharacterized protein LOC114722308 [Neltuma alba]|uniref:uncharacterized protein LOC114722308 n=1 Tax=Neltuma alba TaxID=207710 RepID=UPI0010A421F3|nr:uncharacterized protein LOC114722308 [Prosopis alba]
MNARAMKEEVDETSETKRVETVEYRSSAGQGLQERKVEVIHKPHFSEASKSNTSGGVLAGAAAAVASTLQSAQDALSQK